MRGGRLTGRSYTDQIFSSRCSIESENTSKGLHLWKSPSSETEDVTDVRLLQSKDSNEDGSCHEAAECEPVLGCGVDNGSWSWSTG